MKCCNFSLGNLGSRHLSLNSAGVGCAEVDADVAADANGADAVQIRRVRNSTGYGVVTARRINVVVIIASRSSFWEVS